MCCFSEWKHEWLDKDPRSLNGYDKDILQELLTSVKTSDLKQKEDYKDYLNVLALYRKSAFDPKYVGEGFITHLREALFGGEGSYYFSDKFHFIYELIQNADDTGAQKLVVYFNENEGYIRLTYNERGFTPRDVYNITGIAEYGKKLEAGKVQIGEKGIGFKSVFGFAKTVYIRSGDFSFRIDDKDFTKPIPEYNSFKHQKGTELTLCVRPEDVREIYDSLVKKYKKKQTLLEKNPILFLQHIKNLQLGKSWNDNIVFDLNPGVENKNELFDVQDGFTIGIRINNVAPYPPVKCVRLKRPIVFDAEMIRSRYGSDVEINEPRQMEIITIFPYPNEIEDGCTGALYSFLPTDVTLNIPAYCHVPFKLAASRLHVDSQKKDNNQKVSRWHEHCCIEWGKMLDDALVYISEKFKGNVLKYLPKLIDRYYVHEVQEDTYESLKCEALAVERLYTRKLFWCTDGNAYTNNECCYYGHDRAEEAHSALCSKTPLFVYSEICAETLKTGYGFSNALSSAELRSLLFKRGFTDETISAGCFHFLEKEKEREIDNTYKSVINELSNEDISVNIIECLSAYPKLWEILQNQWTKIPLNLNIKYDSNDIISLSNVLDTDDIKIEDKNTKTYLESISYKCIAATFRSKKKESSHPLFFAAKNVLVLDAQNSFDSFKECNLKMDKDGTFAISLLLKSASRQLDRMTRDENPEGSDSEFMSQLYNVRMNTMNALDSRGYKSYIRVLQQAGSSPTRFINELIQNADDATYAEGVNPEFKIIKQKDGTIITNCNEKGFTRKDVRAITAIAESDKQEIIKNSNKIGEKGVGFKSVFSLFSRVDIDSQSFHFYLESNSPTVPKLQKGSDYRGTKMVFTPELDKTIELSNADDALALCLALRQLKHIVIGENDIQIHDENKIRTITVNGKELRFDIFDHDFTITDEKLIRERSEGHRKISPKQKITFYIPQKKNNKEWRLYNGLPTNITIASKFAIDAPYWLTTSREEVLDNSPWNKKITENIANTIASLVETRIKEEGADALRYIAVDGPTPVIFKDQIRNFFTQMSDEYKGYLMNAKILPTLEEKYFVAPVDHSVVFLQQIAIEYVKAGGDIKLSPKQIVCGETIEKYKSVLEVLGYKQMSDKDTCEKLKDIDAKIMCNESFRTALYEWLLGAEIDSRSLNKHRIIPVLPTSGSQTIYMTHDEIQQKGGIYVSSTAKESEEEFLFLDENILPRKDYRDIFKEEILNVSDNDRKDRFIEKLKTLLLIEKYDAVLQSYNTERDKWMRGDWKKDIRSNLYSSVRILGRDGKYKHLDDVFCCNDTNISGPFVNTYAVDICWNEFAIFFKRNKFRDIAINDILHYRNSLCEDDIEALISYGFTNYEGILIRFIIQDLVSDALIEKYNLQYLKQLADENKAKETEAEFPTETNEEAEKLKEETAHYLERPVKVEKYSANILGYSIVDSDESMDTLVVNSLPSKHISKVHQDLLGRYGNKQDYRCFCQMCQEALAPDFISQTEIIGVSGMFWPQLYISACYRCKNKLDTYKQNIPDYCQHVYDALMNADTEAPSTFIDVCIGKEYSVRYKRSHYNAVKQIVSAYTDRLSTDFNEDNHQVVNVGNQEPSYSVGEIIEFGKFYWDEDESAGKNPITWKVLSIDEESKTALLISEMGLIGGKCYSTDRDNWREWSHSPICHWLNGEFLESAFDKFENSKLVEDKGDKVRLLTLDECTRYFETNAARKLVPTPYAWKSGATTDSDAGHKLNGKKTCWWWLRDSKAISRGGKIRRVVTPTEGWPNSISADQKTGAIRPVIRISTVNNVQNDQQRALRTVITKRKITRLIHFTPIENLKSIIEHGLVPRCEAEKLDAICMDEVRLDNHKDTVSLSISEPNFRLLYKRARKQEEMDPLRGIAILIINPDVLFSKDLDDVSFCRNNAASKRAGDVSWHTGVRSLQAMFDDVVVDSDGNEIKRQLNNLKPYHTTDPQAEILIRGSIPVKYIERIEVRSASEVDCCKEDLKAHDIDIEICSTQYWPKQGEPWDYYSQECKR